MRGLGALAIGMMVLPFVGFEFLEASGLSQRLVVWAHPGAMSGGTLLPMARLMAAWSMGTFTLAWVVLTGPESWRRTGTATLLGAAIVLSAVGLIGAWSELPLWTARFPKHALAIRAWRLSEGLPHLAHGVGLAMVALALMARARVGGLAALPIMLATGPISLVALVPVAFFAWVSVSLSGSVLDGSTEQLWRLVGVLCATVALIGVEMATTALLVRDWIQPKAPSD